MRFRLLSVGLTALGAMDCNGDVFGLYAVHVDSYGFIVFISLRLALWGCCDFLLLGKGNLFH